MGWPGLYQDIGFSGCLLTLWRQLDPDGTGLGSMAPC